MIALRPVERVEQAEANEIRALLERVSSSSGHPALSDDHLLGLRAASGPAPAPGADGGQRFQAVLATDGGTLVGYAQALGSPPPPPTPTPTPPAGTAAGTAAGTDNLAEWSMVVVSDPTVAPGSNLDGRLAAALLGAVGHRGGGRVRLWAYQSDSRDVALATALGLRGERTLYQMRRPLPVEETFELRTRPFRVGADEDAWLAVNNRAFAWHPEQSGWTRTLLEDHEHEPWFDPDGFLLHEADGRLAGFCWTKVHKSTDDGGRLGEIYVIATDPDFAGRGLGRRLVLAGLAHLAGQGIDTAMLYTEATNKPAVKLYVDLDFVVDHLDRSFVTVLPAPGAP